MDITDLNDDQTSVTERWAWATHWTDLLSQQEVWRNAEGQILRLDDMDPGYCERVHHFVMRQADDVFDLIGLQAVTGPAPDSYQASIDFDRALDDFFDTDPKEWVRTAPLLTALANRARGLPAQATTCHCGYPIDKDWDHQHCRPGIIVD